MNLHKRRHASGGYVIVQMAAFILLSLVISVIAIDVGYNLTAQNLLQTASDASSLAATQELFTNTSDDPEVRLASAREQAAALVATYALEETPLAIDTAVDVIFGYIDPVTGIYNPDTFANGTADPNYAPTGGYNAVMVRVRKTDGSPAGNLTSVMANLVGIGTMETGAVSIAMMDPNISTIISGLRPFYGCMAQFNAANEDGDPTNNEARIYGSPTLDGQTLAGCDFDGDDGTGYTNGNWGFACFDGNCGMSEVGTWIEAGYDGPINTGTEVTMSGAALSSVTSELDALITDPPTTITIALLEQVEKNGRTAVVIGGYAGFVITSYKATGPSAQRHVTGYYTNNICTGECLTQATEYFSPGTMKLRLVGM